MGTEEAEDMEKRATVGREGSARHTTRGREGGVRLKTSDPLHAVTCPLPVRTYRYVRLETSGPSTPTPHGATWCNLSSVHSPSSPHPLLFAHPPLPTVAGARGALRHSTPTPPAARRRRAERRQRAGQAGSVGARAARVRGWARLPHRLHQVLLAGGGTGRATAEARCAHALSSWLPDLRHASMRPEGFSDC